MIEDMEQYRGALQEKAFSGPCLRKYPDIEDPLNIDPFWSDLAKLMNSKALRRLQHKTQVYPLPDQEHIRTRLIHSLEVQSNSIVISDYLGLNTTLCSAVALGHDIGHTPFGHIGEKVITYLSREQYGVERPFKHNIFGVVVAQEIERHNENGLNLSYPTLGGILNHNRDYNGPDFCPSVPLEFAVVKYADCLSFVFADVNDSVRMGSLDKGDLQEFFDFRNKNQRLLVTDCMRALIRESAENGHISFRESEVARNFSELTEFMYKKVYEVFDWSLQIAMLEKIYLFFSEDGHFKGADPLVMLALLTDKQAELLGGRVGCNKLVLYDHLESTGIMEMMPCVKDRAIDYSDPDLNKEDFKIVI